MTIIASIQNGRIVPEGPLPWPEGTRLQLQALDPRNGQITTTGGPDHGQAAGEQEERLDWEVHIEAPPRQQAYNADVQFIAGGLREPRIVSDDTEN